MFTTWCMCDDKSKIGVGRPAVSRYHQLRKFFVAGDDPNYNDHDFPTPGYLICPSGYMVISQPKPDGLTLSDYDITTDSSGRDHVVYGHTGPLGLFNRASMFHQSNVEKHVNDLLYMSEMPAFCAQFEKPMMVIVTDGGPDWSPQSPLVNFYYGRLWQALNLDLLVAVTYAPGHSAMNPIEHAWSPISGELAGLVLPDRLVGERFPPSRQKLGGQERREKEAILFDSNLAVLSNVLESKTFDGHQVRPVKVPCTTTVPGLQRYNDYENVKRYFKVGISTVYSTPALAKIDKEWQLFSKHIDKRHYSVIFKKCGERACSHCFQHPIECRDVLDALPTPEKGALFYAPTPSADDSHFKTYLELKTAGPDTAYTTSLGVGGVTGRCTEPGCCWVFGSAADENRHTRLVHRTKCARGKRESDRDIDGTPPAKKTKYYTTCRVCDKTFPSPHYLNKHKTETGHKKQ
ncbi:uncharacterized protein [Littorina saxatilis]|uniref:uncharacterized protein n=1 Tax=Littorina saxatilis TaxID=31220 RepID=UPI0038B52ADC